MRMSYYGDSGRLRPTATHSITHFSFVPLLLLTKCTPLRPYCTPAPLKNRIVESRIEAMGDHCPTVYSAGGPPARSEPLPHALNNSLVCICITDQALHFAHPLNIRTFMLRTTYSSKRARLFPPKSCRTSHTRNARGSNGARSIT